MAQLNDLGQVLARCVGCEGGKSRFESQDQGKGFGVVVTQGPKPGGTPWYTQYTDYHYRLFRCVGCGMGALGVIRMQDKGATYPSGAQELIHFHPEAKERLSLPKDVPEGIQREFREAEMCLEHECYRAAAALFRSVLDKTLKANGYKSSSRSNLQAEIDEAARDGIITEARKRRAHEDIRVLGNDILHGGWRSLGEGDVTPAHIYTQRILEDLYGDRPTVLKQLLAKGRQPQDNEKDDLEETPNEAAQVDN